MIFKLFIAGLAAILFTLGMPEWYQELAVICLLLLVGLENYWYEKEQKAQWKINE